MRILLISNSFNGFTQRVLTDLIDAGHEARVELPSGPDAMREAVDRFEPELILCPFLTQIVPKDIWTNYLVVILHPGIKGDRGPSSIDWAIMQSSREWGVTALEADEETDAGDIWSTHAFNLPLAAKSYVYRTHVIEAGMKCVFGLLDKLDGLHMRVDELVEPQEMGKREGRASSGFSRNWTAFAYTWMSFVEPVEMGKVCNSPSTLKERVMFAKRRVHAKCADLLPEPLNPENRTIEGRLRPLMKQVDRKIDWQTDATEAIVRKIHAADGFPGVRDQICGRDYLLFGAHFEDILGRDSVASPGDIIATRYGAICRKTVDGAVWVSHLKRKVEGAKFFKLPATTVLPGELLAGTPETAIPPSFTGEYRTFKEIWYKEKNGVGYLFFEFHNGAMSTEQCKRLEAAVREIRRRPTKVLVFMGGVNFWSNGIHLNVIEAAPDPAIESWNNINAMDDLVLAILTTCDRLTIAALRANAGAGGAMMPLACDRIIIRDGVVLNPHYQSMGLYGSEYWTYSLPKRVGPEKALGLTRDCLPINAGTAAKIGMIDAVIGCDVDTFEANVTAYAETLAESEDYSKLLATKQVQRSRDEARKPLSLYRHEELSKMRENFWGKDDTYHVARRNFVHKVVCGKTPLRLARRQRAEELVYQVTF